MRMKAEVIILNEKKTSKTYFVQSEHIKVNTHDEQVPKNPIKTANDILQQI